MLAIFYILIIILAILSALPVIFVKQFMKKQDYSYFSIGLFIIELVILYTSLVSGYIFFIYKKISITTFYPIIKCIELLIPIIFAIVVYETKLQPINYFGIFLAIIAIVCISWK